MKYGPSFPIASIRCVYFPAHCFPIAGTFDLNSTHIHTHTNELLSIHLMQTTSPVLNIFIQLHMSCMHVCMYDPGLMSVNVTM